MATRDVTAGAASAASASAAHLIAFVEMDFSGGFVRVTNAGHNIDWNGYTWIGVGQLGSMEQITETVAIEAAGIAFSLSGVDTANIALALGEHYQGRSARVWIGAVSGGAIVADPVQFAGHLMDQMNVQDGSTATITVTAESRLASWSRPRIRRFNAADQRAQYPGDSGLDFIAELASGKEIIWGRG